MSDLEAPFNLETDVIEHQTLIKVPCHDSVYYGAAARRASSTFEPVVRVK